MSAVAGRRVLVAMSGGVDSSVAAAVLVDAGYDVTGVTMKLWGGESDSGCCSVSDVDDARRVAQQLGIDFYVFNFGDEFDEHVVEPYVAAHRNGHTPNPCIECNRHLKFDALLRRADALGFDLVATGHHAQVVTDGDGIHHLTRGADADKDQSYVLSMLGQGELARVLFPIGNRTKHDVRAEATRRGLRTASKPDSQDVCFITATGGGRPAFLADRVALTPGRLVDADGSPLGSVAAVQLVTVGQRKGLGLGGGEPRYAVDVDVAAGVVTVGSADDLLVHTTTVEGCSWSQGTGPQGPIAVRAQSSAHGAAHAAIVEPSDVAAADTPLDTAVVRWDDPIRRIAPGQTVAFYDGDDRVVGSGIAR
jgi:tRNA-specific 2-thiouridylase